MLTLILTEILNGKNVFITGPGGSGKTTLLKKIIENLPAEKTGVTSTTGVASLIVGGATLHSYLGIGLGKKPVLELVKHIQKINKTSVWTRLKYLIIDEISMLSLETFEKLNEIGSITRRNKALFGGIQLILVGDFLQLPCISGKFVFEGDLWNALNFTIYNLKTVYRQLDSTFYECLCKTRLGNVTDDDIALLTSNDPEYTDGILPTQIFCLNVDVDEMNQRQLNLLASPKIYEYELEVEYEKNLNFKPSFIVANYCNAPSTLKLCVGAQVMLLTNFHKTAGLVNGSKGVVVNFDSDGNPIVKFMNATIAIPIHKWEVYSNITKIATIHQWPLRLAWAITVHKIQGSTLDRVVIDLKGVFAYGQAYVAVSRARDLKCLKLLNVSKASFKAHPKALEFYQNLENTEVC